MRRHRLAFSSAIRGWLNLSIAAIWPCLRHGFRPRDPPPSPPRRSGESFPRPSGADSSSPSSSSNVRNPSGGRVTSPISRFKADACRTNWRIPTRRPATAPPTTPHGLTSKYQSTPQPSARPATTWLVNSPPIPASRYPIRSIRFASPFRSRGRTIDGKRTASCCRTAFDACGSHLPSSTREITSKSSSEPSAQSQLVRRGSKLPLPPFRERCTDPRRSSHSGRQKGARE
jgi:hypothetical protein